MLQLRTVEPRTLELLGQLMEIPELGSFVLAGGTAVSLNNGHRLSIDLNLFSTIDFDSTHLVIFLERKFPGFRYSSLQNTVGLLGYIESINTDFVRHYPYPIFQKPIIESSFRLMSMPDISKEKSHNLHVLDGFVKFVKFKNITAL